MNKRQAKIKALWLASGILDGVDGIYMEMPEEDQRKIEAEFRKITDRLSKRAHNLTITSEGEQP